jgi:hypothetical protein
VHFSAQPEPVLTLEPSNQATTPQNIKLQDTTQRFPQNVLTTTQEVDECKVLFSGLVELQVLNLGWCNSVTSGEISSLRGLRKLREVNLARTRVDDYGVAWMEGLTDLTAVNLAGCRITDAAIFVLSGLRQLRHLSLVRRCRLAVSNPCWKCLWFKRSKLQYDETLSTVAFKFDLRQYSLEWCRITDTAGAVLSLLHGAHA